MKTIGMLGGTSWESTREYYRIINEEVQKRLGIQHSARIALYSIDFYDIESRVSQGKMAELSEFFCTTARKIEAGGADCLLICANTIHMFAREIQDAVKIPLIHIVDVCRNEVKRQGLRSVGLLGTRPTMEMDFFKSNFARDQIKVIVPEEEDREYIHQCIFTELFKGETWESSRGRVLEIIKKLGDKGAGGVIMGCTELPLLINQRHTSIKLFDTTLLHALAGVDFALE